jgi:lipid-A-disaccharide synthase-like uncharacterized protein
MNQLLFELTFFGHPLVITGWKLVGYAGVALFTSRWIVQLFASHLAGRSTIPRLFWYLSLSGSLLLLAYFMFGKNDSVGILSNLFPSLIAAYNLSLDIRHGRQSGTAAIRPHGPAE